MLSINCSLLIKVACSLDLKSTFAPHLLPEATSSLDSNVTLHTLPSRRISFLIEYLSSSNTFPRQILSSDKYFSLTSTFHHQVPFLLHPTSHPSSYRFRAYPACQCCLLTSNSLNKVSLCLYSTLHLGVSLSFCQLTSSFSDAASSLGPTSSFTWEA